jgi:hypothetical protein
LVLFPFLSSSFSFSSQLLAFLQTFATNVTTRTKALQNDLEDLVFESQAADLRLHNTFNSLLMLSNNQFIENVRLLFFLLLLSRLVSPPA